MNGLCNAPDEALACTSAKAAGVAGASAGADDAGDGDSGDPISCQLNCQAMGPSQVVVTLGAAGTFDPAWDGAVARPLRAAAARGDSTAARLAEGLAEVPTAAAFDALLAQPDPTAGEARRVAAAVYRLAADPTPPAWFAGRLAAAQTFLEAHEPKLPVRSVWLVAGRLAGLVWTVAA